MALFLSYLLFMVGSVVIAIAAKRVSSVSERARKYARRQSPADVRRGGRLTLVSDDGTAAEPTAPVTTTETAAEADWSDGVRGIG